MPRRPWWQQLPFLPKGNNDILIEERKHYNDHRGKEAYQHLALAVSAPSEKLWLCTIFCLGYMAS